MTGGALSGGRLVTPIIKGHSGCMLLSFTKKYDKMVNRRIFEQQSFYNCLAQFARYLEDVILFHLIALYFNYLLTIIFFDLTCK